MKTTLRSTIYASLGLLSFALYLSSFSSGPANAQGQDRTGGPFSQGACQACHSSGSFDPSVDLQLLLNDEAVNNYVPGASYTVRITVDAAQGTPSAYGFQALALDGNDQQAGAFANPASGISIVDLNDRMYAEQMRPQSENTFEFEWTAPTEGVGSVTFYAAGNAVNGDGGIGGDNGVNTSFIFEEMTSSTQQTLSEITDFYTIGNPVAQSPLQAQIRTLEAGNYQLSLWNLSGQRIANQHIQLLSGAQQIELAYPDQAKGLHFLSIEKDGAKQVQKVLIQ